MTPVTSSPSRIAEVLSDEPEGGVALDHLQLRRADPPDLEEVVHEGEARAADLLGDDRQLGEARTHLGGAALPGEVGDVDTGAHDA